MKKRVSTLVCLLFSLTMISAAVAGCTSDQTVQDEGTSDEEALDEEAAAVDAVKEDSRPSERVYDQDAAADRRSFMQKYRNDDKVQQVLIISYTEMNNAIAQFYEKLPEENNAWSLVFESEAYIGLDGVGECNESVCVTPLGDFEVQKAFGIRKNPGTVLEYIDIKPTTYACCDDCEYYNQIIDIEETGHECEGEEMNAFSPEYNYGLTIDYNSECIYPNGSNIFIHCKGLKPYTGACIALSEEDMITVLKHAEPGMRLFVTKFYADPAE